MMQPAGSFTNTLRARKKFRFVISGIHRGTIEARQPFWQPKSSVSRIDAAGSTIGRVFGKTNRSPQAAAREMQQLIATRARGTDAVYQQPVAFGADLNGPGTSRAVFTNTTAIRPIDREVNMAAIQWIWMAFVALSTVFAASLWATIIAEFWKARAKKGHAVGRRFIDSRPL